MTYLTERHSASSAKGRTLPELRRRDGQGQKAICRPYESTCESTGRLLQASLLEYGKSEHVTLRLQCLSANPRALL